MKYTYIITTIFFDHYDQLSNLSNTKIRSFEKPDLWLRIHLTPYYSTYILSPNNIGKASPPNITQQV